MLKVYDSLTAFVCKHTDDRFYLDGNQCVSVRSIIAREIVSNILMYREYASPFPAKLVIKKDKCLLKMQIRFIGMGKSAWKILRRTPKIR